MINKRSHPCPPQGVTVSLLCRDVVWLTEEVLFRKKDVGFGGSVTQVVHYSLTLLAPYLIMAAAPSRWVYSKINESSNVLLLKSYLVKPLLHFNPFFSFGSLPPGRTLSLCLIHHSLPRCTSVTRLRLLHTPLFWKLWGVSNFLCMGRASVNCVENSLNILATDSQTFSINEPNLCKLFSFDL